MIAAVGIHVTIGEVAASLALVAVAAAVSLWRRAELEGDLAVAVIRSFLQLTAVGYVIQAIFDSDSLWLVVLLLGVMVGFGSITARSRAKGVPGALRPIVLALASAAIVTIGLVLALGATAWEAARDVVTRSLRSGMITLIDSTKTTGVVFFPGTMVGMLLAGARPLDAVRLQLILLWSLLGSVALSSVLATSLGYRGFFTPAHQLRELDD